MSCLFRRFLEADDWLLIQRCRLPPLCFAMTNATSVDNDNVAGISTTGSLPLLRDVVKRIRFLGNNSEVSLTDELYAPAAGHRSHFKPYIIAARFCGNYAVSTYSHEQHARLYILHQMHAI